MGINDKINKVLGIPTVDNIKNLPEKITIYRGSYSRWGISWTLNKDIAEWFATRFKAVNKIETVNTQVFKQEVYRDNCIAYFNDREEEEIIYLGE